MAAEKRAVKAKKKKDVIELDANIHKNGPSKFVLNANSAVNDGLVSWIIQFGGKIQVTSPNELKNMVLKRAEEIKSAYTI